MNRFQGPYSGGSGQKVPPVRGSGPLSAPMGRPKRLTYPLRLPSPFARYAKEYPGLAASPYIRLMNIDPMKTNRFGRMADAYLQQFMPEWTGIGYKGDDWKQPIGPVGKIQHPFIPADCPGYFKITFCDGHDGQPGRQVNLCGFTTTDPGPAPVLGPDGVGVQSFSTWSGPFGSIYFMESIWSRKLDPQPAYGPWIPQFPKVDGTPPPGPYYTIWPQVEEGDPLGFPLDPLPAPARLSPRLPPVAHRYVPKYGVPANQYALTRSGGGFVKTPVVHNNLPPGPGEKEKKFDLYGNPAYRAFANAAGGFSEMREGMKDIAGAIPGNPCKGLSPGKLAACILDNADKINWSLALQNLLKDQLSDRIIGTMSSKTTKNFKRAGLLIGGRGYGLSRYGQGGNGPK